MLTKLGAIFYIETLTRQRRERRQTDQIAPQNLSLDLLVLGYIATDNANLTVVPSLLGTRWIQHKALVHRSFVDGSVEPRPCDDVSGSRTRISDWANIYQQ